MNNKKIKRLTGIILALLLIAGQFLNNGTGIHATGRKISLNTRKISLSVGQSRKLSVKNAKSQSVKWTSSDKQVASVNKNGLVKAKKAGKAVITAKVTGKKLKCNVTVRKAAPQQATETPSPTALPSQEPAITPAPTAVPEVPPIPSQEPETTPDVVLPEDSRLLVAYFSWSGTSERIAQNIINQTGADSFRIERETPYSTNYNEVAYGEAQTEAETNARPPIKDPLQSISQYDKIILCYPIWWHTAPMTVGTFLESYDFTGKTIYPVSQSASMDRGQYQESVAFIKECAKGSTVDDGLFSKDNTEIQDYINEKVLK